MDVITVLKSAKSKGAKIASIVNVPYSTIQKMSSISIENSAGQEVCVAATKSFTNQLITLFAIAGAKVVAEAQEQAGRAITATRDAVNAEVSTRTAALDKDLGAKIRAAEASIDKARGQALAELDGVAVEVAQAAIQRLVGVNVTADEAKAALAAVQKEVA